MRKISFSVTPNGSIEPSLLEIGHEGEHNATTLIATLPQELLSEATYYRLSIGSYQTDKLYAENNTLSYTVPQCVLICGTQFLQLEGYKNSAEGEVLLVFKSDIAMVNVLPSIDPYNQVTDEVKCEVDDALGKLHYYVTQSDELAAELKNTTDECASILEEAKQTVYGKADKANTLSGYGITDAYTKSQTDNLLSGKADKLEEWRTVYEEASHSGTLDKEVEYDGYTYPNRYCYSVTSKFSPNKKYRISSSCCFNSSTRNRVEIHIGDVKYTPEYKQIIDHENVLVVGWYTEFTFTGDTEKTFAKIYFYDTDTMPWTECPSIDIKIEEYDYAFAYTKNETDQLLSSKVDKTDVWTKDEAYPSVYVDELVEALEMHKADKATTLAGYGITDAMTSNEIQNIQSDIFNYIDNETDRRLKTQLFDGSTTFLDIEHNAHYRFTTPVTSLELCYPLEDFICSLEFTVSDEGFTLILPNSRYLGGTPTFMSGETWELNIMNGVVVGGLIE